LEDELFLEDKALKDETQESELEERAGRETAEDLYRNALQGGVRLLSRREHSRLELTRKLRQKGHGEELVQRVIDHLDHDGLQSDERFVESFVYNRIGNGQGPVKIRLDLMERGIGETLAERALSKPANYWVKRAEGARSKKYGLELPEQGKSWNQQARFLSQRGYPADLIYQVLG